MLLKLHKVGEKTYTPCPSQMLTKFDKFARGKGFDYKFIPYTQLALEIDDLDPTMDIEGHTYRWIQFIETNIDKDDMTKLVEEVYYGRFTDPLEVEVIG